MTDMDNKNIQLLGMTSDIVCTYIAQNQIPAEDLPKLIKNIYHSLENPGNDVSFKASSQTPAVPVNKSVQNDYIICLEDGKKLKMLRRYLKVNFNLTPEEYREKWNLPRDYPMVAPSYSKRRSSLAKDIGLGKKDGSALKKKSASVPPSKKRGRGRPKKAA